MRELNRNLIYVRLQTACINRLAYYAGNLLDIGLAVSRARENGSSRAAILSAVIWASQDTGSPL